jgi:hypothetical protein
MVNLSWIRVTCVLRQWSGGLSHTTHPEGLQKVADALRSDDATVLLKQICESWIYTTCLCFALDMKEQNRSGFRYEYSSYQLEYSRNLQFHVGGQMEQVFQSLIDRTRASMDLDKVKTILGYQRRVQSPLRLPDAEDLFQRRTRSAH